MHTSEFFKNQLAFIQSKNFIILLSGLILVSLFSSTNLTAQGSLMVFPSPSLHCVEEAVLHHELFKAFLFHRFWDDEHLVPVNGLCEVPVLICLV